MSARSAAGLAAHVALAWAPAGAAAATQCLAVAGAMAFGIYDTLPATPNDTTGTVTVTCTPGLGDPLTTVYTVSIAGTGAANDAVRSIAWGTQRLYFQVYKDAPRTLVWGDGVAATGVVGSVTSAAPAVPGVRVHTAYGRMPARQSVAAGVYTGTLLVTVEY